MSKPNRHSLAISYIYISICIKNVTNEKHFKNYNTSRLLFNIVKLFTNIQFHLL